MINNKTSLYPLKFTPILKEKVWGGNKLTTILNKGADEKTGESWEISGVDDDISVVSNGYLKGKNLNWLIKEYKEMLVGVEVYQKFGDTFPLLFKFIDAAEDLSVQVHPGDFLAKTRHNSFGKAEMWYILQADKNARLIVGFNNEFDTVSYQKALSENRIVEILNSIQVEKGDAFIINPGTVHAIGAGILLAEIQQTSDVTYRIYDWDRPGIDGKMRQLHNELALDAINFSAHSKKNKYKQEENSPFNIGGTKYFWVNKFNVSRPLVRKLDSIDSFIVYMCLEGMTWIEGDGFSEKVEMGETILIPAYLKEIKFITQAVSLLEVYLP